MDENIPYYGGLIQVRYYSVDDKKYHGALCYHDTLVDGDSGEAKRIIDVIQAAQQDGIATDDAIIELSWNAIGKPILD